MLPSLIAPRVISNMIAMSWCALTVFHAFSLVRSQSQLGCDVLVVVVPPTTAGKQPPAPHHFMSSY